MSNMKLYNNGIVYKLYGTDINNNTIIYIGATVNLLCNRKAIHKYHAKKYKLGEYDKYCSSFILFDTCSNIKIEAIDKLQNCNLSQLRELEDKYIKQYECINKNYAKADRQRHLESLRKCAKNYYYKNLETERAKKKAYYHNNKEAVIKRAKEFYSNNKEKMREYQREYNKRPEVKEKIKAYREKNKEKAREYAKSRYDKIKKNNID